MTKYFLCILSIFLFQLSLLAFNGERRLSKKNIVAIHSNDHGSLILNDSNGNIFEYNGDQVVKQEFDNDIDSPTVIFINQKNEVLYSNANSLFYQKRNGEAKEILSVPAFETIFKAVENEKNYYVSSSAALYEIEKSTGKVSTLYENNVEKTNKLVCGKKDCYVAMNNIVINLSKDNLVEYKLPSNITDIDYHLEHGLLTLSENRVFVSNKEGSRKLFPSIGNFPTGIKDICGSERWLYLITDNSVSIFDWENSEVKYLGDFNGFQMAVHIDQWDNLWLSSNQGVWNFSGSSTFESPRIIDLEVSDKNNKILDSKPVVFSAETNMVNITPKIIYLPNTDRLINEWRIKGGDWRPFVKDFALSEKMLSDGKNIIFIRSKSNESAYSMPYNLEIKNSANDTQIPTIWYAAFGIIGSLLVVAFISLFNIRGEQNKDRLQIEKLKAQNELLQTKQQIDQLKMNPHFVFNALNSINGLIATGKIPESRKAIGLFSKFLRQFLYQSQEENIILEEEITLLENYVKIEQLCRNDNFRFKLDLIDDSLLDVKLPNMIIQPFIENAILHAFPDNNQKGEITLTIKEEEGFLVAMVKDNGIGLNNTTAKKNHKSVAIDLVRKRLAQRDKNRRKSYLEYMDNNPGTIAKIYLQRL